MRKAKFYFNLSFLASIVVFLIAILESSIFYLSLKKLEYHIFIIQTMVSALFILFLLIAITIDKLFPVYWRTSFWNDKRFANDVCKIQTNFSKKSFLAFVILTLLIIGISFYTIFIRHNYNLNFSQIIALCLLFWTTFFALKNFCKKINIKD
ncbi:hypothetical protein [Mesomycoplasma conjunctivae]|uniref:hypothetical protein n=1 Tax=Mesomycoplasma conjunctivae TaxID=45361 RepID=UPI003DA2251A